MRIQFYQSFDFNQMLVFSVFGHLVILIILLFLPKPSVAVKTITPAFMVNLVEIPLGKKQAARKKPANENKGLSKQTKLKVKKTATKKKVSKKKAVQKKPSHNPNKILKALKKLDKKATQ